MENDATTADLEISSEKQDESPLMRVGLALRKFTLQFLLPLIAIGPLLIGAEKIAELLGFHGTDTQFIRMIMLGVYAVIFFTVVGSAKKR